MSEEALARAADVLLAEGGAVALTGAGISVESGIPDFRSPGGLWTRFEPMEYATLSCFLSRPDKAWKLYRALGETLVGTRPNRAHAALARLEREGLARGIVTQNVDGLHQAAGCRCVIEIHGDHRSLQCIRCGLLDSFDETLLLPGPVPTCRRCGLPMKPNVVLFEEPVRGLDEIHALLAGCRLLLVVGTSAEVAPASLIPGQVLAQGGSVIEANVEPTVLTRSGLGPRGVFLRGSAGETLPALAAAALQLRARTGVDS